MTWTSTIWPYLTTRLFSSASLLKNLTLLLRPSGTGVWDHTPLKSKSIADHSDCLWYTDELGDMKHYERKLEREHKQTKLTVDLEIYRDACATYDTLRLETKKKYYTNQVESCQNDHKSLFSIINKLLHRSPSSSLPASDNPTVLAQNFADFLLSKINKINHSSVAWTKRTHQLW